MVMLVATMVFTIVDIPKVPHLMSWSLIFSKDFSIMSHDYHVFMFVDLFQNYILAILSE